MFVDVCDKIVKLVNPAEVKLTMQYLRVSSDNADFTLRVVMHKNLDPEFRWTVVAREPWPGLGTWWNEWPPKSCDTDAIVEQFIELRLAVERLLHEQIGNARYGAGSTRVNVNAEPASSLRC